VGICPRIVPISPDRLQIRLHGLGFALGRKQVRDGRLDAERLDGVVLPLGFDLCFERSVELLVR